MSEPVFEARALVAGRQLGKYRLEHLLGVGGMGTVWAAHDADLDRHVALKVLNASLAHDDTAQVRLVREAQAMARLRHPNVITVFDAVTIEGHSLVAMELVEGDTMASWLATEPRDLDAVVATLIAAGRGLVAAHAAGMIHRDFKPHNVLVETGGRVLVTDFGLARATGELDVAPRPRPSAPSIAVTSSPEPDATVRHRPSRPSGELDGTEAQTISDSAIGSGDTVASPHTPTTDRAVFATPLTRTGTVLGTPAYMAPEQFRGEHADARADQFAFCVTAWEAICGKRPFTGMTYEALALAVADGAPSNVDAIPKRLRPALLRGLERDPAARWPSMEALLAELERAWRPTPRRIDPLVWIGAVFTIAFVITIVVSRGNKQAPERAAPVVATPSCPRGADAIQSTWSPATRTELARLAGPEAAGAVALIERWAATWIGAFDTNCAAPADPDFVARRLCLEAQRDDLSIMLNDLTIAAAVIGKAELGRVMPSAIACVRSPRAIAPPLPTDPSSRQRITQLRIKLHTLKTEMLRGAPVADLERQSADFVTQASALGYPPAHAEALFTHALVLQIRALQGDRAALPAAIEAYAAAANRAEGAGTDRVRVDSLLGQLQSAIGVYDAPAIDELVRRAEVSATRLGDPGPEHMLEMLRAQIAFDRGLWSEAVQRAERARIGWEASGATETLAQAALLEANARVSRHAGDDLERALAAIAVGLSHEVRAKDALIALRVKIEKQLGKPSP